MLRNPKSTHARSKPQSYFYSGLFQTMLFLSVCISPLCAMERNEKEESNVQVQQKIPKTEYSITLVKKGLYVGQAKDLSFVMEEINRDTFYGFWKDFADSQIKGATTRIPIETKSHRLLSTVNHGAPFFKFPIAAFNDANVWVGYVSKLDINDYSYNLFKEKKNDFKKSIVMVVSVSSANEVPFTTHLGIFKTVLYTLRPEEGLKNLSPFLHSFGAFLSENYLFSSQNKKEYMATRPAVEMRNILRKILPENAYFLGSQNQFNAWKKEQKNPQEYSEIILREMLECYPNGIESAKEPPLVTGKEKWKFTLKSAQVVEFEPTSINRYQIDHLVPWMIIDLQKLGSLYPWAIVGKLNERN